MLSHRPDGLPSPAASSSEDTPTGGAPSSSGRRPRRLGPPELQHGAQLNINTEFINGKIRAILAWHPAAPSRKSAWDHPDCRACQENPDLITAVLEMLKQPLRQGDRLPPVVNVPKARPIAGQPMEVAIR